jgi:2-polyprenyl-3-methyl-5-hydroxy-6-metoxy-1,4-benzoquinol methylase
MVDQQSNRRTGDQISIDGAYQYRALREGHPVQRHWHRSKLLLVDSLLKPMPGDRILDVGCGSGVVSAYMANAGASVTAVDGNASAIEFATRQFQAQAERLHFRLGLVDDVGFEPGSFDKAISFEVIEHLHRPQTEVMIAAVAKALAPGGLLLLTTPNYLSGWPAIEFSLDFFGLVPTLKDEQHVSKYTHKRLHEICVSAGFSPVAKRSVCTVGPWLAPFSDRLAVAATGFELKHRVPFGTILAHLYRMP